MPELAPKKPVDTSSGGFQFVPRVMLFATDFSSACDNAWLYAVALANKHHSKLLLAHVIDPNVFSAVPTELLDSAGKRVRLDAEAQLRRLQQHSGLAPLDSELLLRDGEISETLIALTEDYKVDLLVTATRGYSRTKRLLLGSVAEKLFRQVRCPVLVIPEEARFDQELTIHRILCPIDFSPETPEALAFAKSIGRSYGAQLIFMHVLDEYITGGNGEKEQIVREVEHRLRGLLDRDESLPFQTYIEIVFGVPAERISRIATEYRADLIVLSVHAASPTVAHERERTAYETIRWSPCPVVTILRPRRSMVNSSSLVSVEA